MARIMTDGAVNGIPSASAPIAAPPVLQPAPIKTDAPVRRVPRMRSAQTSEFTELLGYAVVALIASLIFRSLVG